MNSALNQPQQENGVSAGRSYMYNRLGLQVTAHLVLANVRLHTAPQPPAPVEQLTSSDHGQTLQEWVCQHYCEVTHTRDTYTGTEDVAIVSYVYRHSLYMHTGRVAKH